MGLKDSLVSMMGDFVELRRNPDFRSKTELAAEGDSDLPDPLQYNPNRRHSLQITCGTQDPQPEMLVHQRTFSISSQKKQQKQNRLSLKQKEADDCASLRQEPLYNRRYKQRRASEPVNLLGLDQWATGSGHKQRQKVQRQPSQSSDNNSASDLPPPPASPEGASSSGGSRSPAHSHSKSGTFAARFFVQHNPIEEAEELEADMLDGQRRQSQSGGKRPSLSQATLCEQQQQRFTTVIRL